MKTCPSCNSSGFQVSILGPDRCTFCDGTEGGNPPVEKCATGSEARRRAEELANEFTTTEDGRDWMQRREHIADTLEPLLEEIDELKVHSHSLRKLLNMVNRVTSSWRHQKEVPPAFLNDLCNRQIEIEEAIRKRNEGKE